MNQYSIWTYIVIGFVLLICTLYALPNIYGEDPAVQISPPYAREVDMDQAAKDRVDNALIAADVSYRSAELNSERLLLRFDNTNDQLKAYSVLVDALDDDFVVAQNLAPATPSWLRSIGGQPMYLGLDLRGGVHFLMQIDMAKALEQDEERYVNEFRTLFRENTLRYRGISRTTQDGVRTVFIDAAVRDQARDLVNEIYQDFEITTRDEGDQYILSVKFTDEAIETAKRDAIEQNLTALRNRVNELGVAEPIIQQQGMDRIVVQLPGVQDTARAKEILGSTATLEFRMVYGDHNDLQEAQRTGRAPVNARLYQSRSSGPVLLQRRVIVTGDQINDAAATIDQRSGSPATVVRLNSQGARRMFDTTRENVGSPMAVVFIEYETEIRVVDGEETIVSRPVEEVINVATIQEPFGRNFQITGLTSSEARNLSLLLKAGALKAPMQIIEERTIGPSLGQESVDMGFISVMLGFGMVMIFMFMRYNLFGLIANVALIFNMIILISLLSLLQATLTLPGIAGIVLTLGMAVDANVLIFERIREEIANGNSPQASITAGYGRAFWTIFDANITTLIAAVFLFGFGTGPIKGFAVTLSLGIVSSMFTAILVSRGIVNYFYGNRRLQSLPI